MKAAKKNKSPIKHYKRKGAVGRTTRCNLMLKIANVLLGIQARSKDVSCLVYNVFSFFITYLCYNFARLPLKYVQDG